MHHLNLKKSRYLPLILLFIFIMTAFIFSAALAALSDIYLPIIYYDAEPTPVLTATPTATPLPQQPDVHILNNHSSYVDGDDYLHIVGEVRNDTLDDLRYVEIDANFYDQHGALLGSEYTYTLLDNLPAQEQTCFDLMLPNPVAWATYSFENPTYWTDGSPLPLLTVVYDGGYYEPAYQRYKISGQVRNDDSQRVEYVTTVGTLYDEYGFVIGCDFTYINSLHLDPGQYSSFELTFSGRDYSNAGAYRLQLDGKPR